MEETIRIVTYYLERFREAWDKLGEEE